MKHQNERTARGHTLGRFFYRLLEGNRSKISEKTLENARKPSKMQKNSTTILSKSSRWFGRSDRIRTQLGESTLSRQQASLLLGRRIAYPIIPTKKSPRALLWSEWQDSNLRHRRPKETYTDFFLDLQGFLGLPRPKAVLSGALTSTVST